MTETTIGKPGTTTPGDEPAPEHPETTAAGYGRGGEDDRGYRAGDYAQHGLGKAAPGKDQRDHAAMAKQRRDKPVRDADRVEPADPKPAGD